MVCIGSLFKLVIVFGELLSLIEYLVFLNLVVLEGRIRFWVLMVLIMLMGERLCDCSVGVLRLIEIRCVLLL